MKGLDRADDLLSLAKSAKELKRMRREPIADCEECGLGFLQEDNLCVWSMWLASKTGAGCFLHAR